MNISPAFMDAARQWAQQTGPGSPAGWVGGSFDYFKKQQQMEAERQKGFGPSTGASPSSLPGANSPGLGMVNSYMQTQGYPTVASPTATPAPTFSGFAPNAMTLGTPQTQGGPTSGVPLAAPGPIQATNQYLQQQGYGNQGYYGSQQSGVNSGVYGGQPQIHGQQIFPGGNQSGPPVFGFPQQNLPYGNQVLHYNPYDPVYLGQPGAQPAQQYPGGGQPPDQGTPATDSSGTASGSDTSGTQTPPTKPTDSYQPTYYQPPAPTPAAPVPVQVSAPTPAAPQPQQPAYNPMPWNQYSNIPNSMTGSSLGDFYNSGGGQYSNAWSSPTQFNYTPPTQQQLTTQGGPMQNPSAWNQGWG